VPGILELFVINNNNMGSCELVDWEEDYHNSEQGLERLYKQRSLKQLTFIKAIFY
jgi:hypothetical protein